jgi:hypothetical protein
MYGSVNIIREAMLKKTLLPALYSKGSLMSKIQDKIKLLKKDDIPDITDSLLLECIEELAEENRKLQVEMDNLKMSLSIAGVYGCGY